MESKTPYCKCDPPQKCKYSVPFYGPHKGVGRWSCPRDKYDPLSHSYQGGCHFYIYEEESTSQPPTKTRETEPLNSPSFQVSLLEALANLTRSQNELINLLTVFIQQY